METAKKFQVITMPITTKYLANVDDTFEHPEQFEDLVFVLDNAVEGDIVEINLTTVGGSLSSIIPLLGAMDTTLATVHVHIASDVASAGTFLLMSADSISCNRYVTIMFHNVSMGYAGPGHNVKSHAVYMSESSDALLKDMYRHFLTDEEISALLSGTEIYMGEEEFVTRYARRAEKLQELQSV